MRPLQAAVTAAKKPADFAWSSECDSAIVAAKRALADAVLLVHPNTFGVDPRHNGRISLCGRGGACPVYTSPSPRD